MLVKTIRIDNPITQIFDITDFYVEENVLRSKNIHNPMDLYTFENDICVLVINLVCRLIKY